ncbi:Tetraspanin-9 [Triplophysa tibetana]|uniref:Tetraspanin-9 n=1 Tax=Triplophysa tibetana TaxID=1572043 RepID=A0A5A9P263_9TELE|nr:Tetraspanin-9 [Triplophysa tibetana]
MEKSSSEESAIHRSPSVDSRDSDFAQASTSERTFGGRGFTAGAFYGSTGPRGQTASQSGEDKSNNKYKAPKGSKYVVFYLDLSFVFLLEFKKFNMARGCLCCLKYTMFVFNLIFWTTPPPQQIPPKVYHSLIKASSLFNSVLCFYEICGLRKGLWGICLPFGPRRVPEWQSQGVSEGKEGAGCRTNALVELRGTLLQCNTTPPPSHF